MMIIPDSSILPWLGFMAIFILCALALYMFQVRALWKAVEKEEKCFIIKYTYTAESGLVRNTGFIKKLRSDGTFSDTRDEKKAQRFFDYQLHEAKKTLHANHKHKEALSLLTHKANN